MRVRFIAVYCLFFLNVLFGQENLSLIQKEQLKFEHLGVSDGLMHNSIVTILQDKKGYMWFGTSNGLYRYDGYNFVYYSNSPDDDFSLLSNEVNVLFEDSKGVIWVGTKFGLCYYNREEDLFISSLRIGSIEADKRKIYAVLPNGISTRRAQGLRLPVLPFMPFDKSDILPGSTIIVPRQARPLDSLALVETITPILANLSVTAASIAAISDN